MRDPNRIDTVLDALRATWLAEPDLRLGQIIANAVREARPGASPTPDLFYLEDQDILEALSRGRS